MVLRSWRKKAEASSYSPGAVDIFAAGNGLLVEGSPTAVSAFVEQMHAATKEVGGKSKHLIVDGAQIAANVAAYAQTHREYVEFSGRARELLKEHGEIAAGDGFYRSFVHNGKAFAGNLDWKPIDIGPEQALSVQAAAGQMALRAAIKEVQAALDRIEGKVDQLVELAEAERLGAVVADRSTLHSLVKRVRSSGGLSSTDWATVASLGPWIARDIESMRAYVTRQLKDSKDSSFVRSRASAADDLTDRLITESIALLVVAEDNYALWQELRLAHTVNHETTATQAVSVDIREQLAALTRADQELADLLQATTNRLSEPTGYEGLAPLQKRRLRRHVGQLDEVGHWFREQRHLDGDMADRPELAGVSESLGKIRSAAADAARSTASAIAETPNRIRNQRQDNTKELDG